MPALRVLSGADVRRLLSMPTAIGLMREAFGALSDGDADAPLRTRIEAPGGASALVMPAALAEGIGAKVVTLQPENPARGLPTIHGLVFLADPETGEPIAVLDAEAFTAIRTGAASGLATDLLARPDAETVTVVGAGVQARSQLEAVGAVRPIRRAWVLSRSPESAARFAAEMSVRLGLDVRPADSTDVLRQSDVICTATPATSPVVTEVAPGTHVNTVGSFRPAMAEIAPAVLAAATVVVDQRAACLAEAGDLSQAIEVGTFSADHIHAEIGEIVRGRRPGRQRDDEVTVFKSVGVAVQDVAAAAYVVREAEARGIGAIVPL